MEQINWSDIIAECGSYKAGFVAIFRKYEGEPTNERDAYKRVVKVTQHSFADHVGIPRATFKRWVQQEMRPELVSKSAKEERTAASHANVIKNMARNNPRALADAIDAAGVGASDQAYHELKLRRAERPGGSLHGLNTDRSPAHRKAVEAQVGDMTEPFRRYAASVGTVAMAEVLDELAVDLQEAITKDVLTGEQFAAIDAAHDRFAIVLAEARILLGEVSR